MTLRTGHTTKMLNFSKHLQAKVDWYVLSFILSNVFVDRQSILQPETLKIKVDAFLTGDDTVSRNADEESDFELLQDLDMSFLGLDGDTYADLIKLERKEYDFLTDDAYKNMRRKVNSSVK